MGAQIVSFHCVVKDRLGHVLSTSFNQEVINQNEAGIERLAGLVDGLQSVSAGEKRSIAVPAARAYGSYDPGLVIELRRSDLKFAGRLMVGSEVMRRTTPGNESRVFRVTRLDPAVVILDGNHPLAGQDLVFEVEVVTTREARAEDFLEAERTFSGSRPLLH